VFDRVPTLTLVQSLRSATLRLWDEQRQRLVGFSRLKTLRSG
jgi:hypothetical protein